MFIIFFSEPAFAQTVMTIGPGTPEDKHGGTTYMMIRHSSNGCGTYTGIVRWQRKDSQKSHWKKVKTPINITVCGDKTVDVFSFGDDPYLVRRINFNGVASEEIEITGRIVKARVIR